LLNLLLKKVHQNVWRKPMRWPFEGIVAWCWTNGGCLSFLPCREKRLKHYVNQRKRRRMINGIFTLWGKAVSCLDVNGYEILVRFCSLLTCQLNPIHSF
jgi:hypothetical protein